MKTKNEYIERLAAKVREWDARIDELKARAEGASSGMKYKVHKEIDDLRALRARAEELLDEARESTGKAWEGVRAKIDKLYEEVKDILKRAA